jgi:hypothetical protein
MGDFGVQAGLNDWYKSEGSMAPSSMDDVMFGCLLSEEMSILGLSIFSDCCKSKVCLDDM